MHAADRAAPRVSDEPRRSPDERRCSKAPALLECAHPMRRLEPLIAAAAVSVGAACAPPPPMRQTTASNARNDDPFLHGTPCPQQQQQQDEEGGSPDPSALRIDDLVVGMGTPAAEGETDLAFGEEGRPPGVPPRSDLVFVIDLFRPAESPSGQGGPPPKPGAATRRR